MTKHNGTPVIGPQQAYENLRGILEHLDIKRFRAVTDAPDAVTDDDILEAMHRARIAHDGIDRVKQNDSRRWLYAKLH